MADETGAQGIREANYDERVRLIEIHDTIDRRFGYERYKEAVERTGYLVNIESTEMVDELTKNIQAAVDLYFLESNGQRFKITYCARPYLYISTRTNVEMQVASALQKKYGGFLNAEVVQKEDLALRNHLSGLKKNYIKLDFPSTNEMNRVKKDLLALVKKNKERHSRTSDYTAMLSKHIAKNDMIAEQGDFMEEINDIREHDVPWNMRVAIDERIFVGRWYTCVGHDFRTRKPAVTVHPTLLDAPDPVILAFDIETTKLPLKFPDSNIDEIMMISYMIDGRGYLIINRDIVSADIDDFEYTPKEEFQGRFHVFNEPDEVSTITRFFDHILEVKPSIIATFNGDCFDWPFVEARAAFHGLWMSQEIGFAKDSQDEYKNPNCVHMDIFRWVKRDSYLPVGSQNLKAVTKAKLRYDPVEVDPEEMCTMARNNPQHLANYSVSDAVATYYLYMKYVHPFIFALCTIIPLGPDDVLRKGSGTLCEALLMVEAFHNNIIFPNKYMGPEGHKLTTDSHVVESETYVGGHVEALESGVFRADIPCRFRLVPSALVKLKKEIRETLEDTLKREMDIPLECIANMEDVVREVEEQLDLLLAHPARLENPRIYHLDVGAMYPNIILTNRLQPSAMIGEQECMACVYNAPDKKCRRVMSWEWRGELIPATKGEYDRIRQQLENETFGKPPRPFHQLPPEERKTIVKKRIQDYCRRAYGKLHITKTEMREQAICQRENAFYVDTVRAFRDRRYEYKELLKKAKASLDHIDKDDASGLKSAKGKVVLYESLQLAHKCILNSFYGYVMRKVCERILMSMCFKGSRWFSMEMAGIVCHTGANIITEARKLVEQVGKPLELDTDGIWCLLPASFPENLTFKLVNYKRKSVTVSYAGAMLNWLVRKRFTNDQYHTLNKEDGSYTVTTENSIFFEVDGPYQCMVLPASKEEGKKLKKRYAVFNLDGSLAELKGFELKRRGELAVIKFFQQAVFKAFLLGSTLDEVYESVAKEADYWLDVLFSKGAELDDSYLFELISENRSMSRKLEEYGGQKSTSISTAKRLAEFLGDSMVKDAGLACRFVISKYPLGAPVTERAIPVAIFHAPDPALMVHYLRKWTKQTISRETFNILDWDYYIERLGSCIQKIITIPAALQGLPNPVPRIAHPDWLDAKIRNRVQAHQQPKITDIFRPASKEDRPESADSEKRKRTLDSTNDEVDIEDMFTGKGVAKRGKKIESQPEPTVLEKKTIEKDGVQSWIAFLKKKWRMGRKVRKNERSANAVERLVNATRESVRERHWQILAIEETREPGLFSMWILVSGQMNRVSVRVSRTLLVNDREPREGVPTIKRNLPHAKPSLFLYEQKCDEQKFAALLDDLNSEMCSLRIEGVYESQTPLLFSAILRLGCVCKLKLGAKSHGSVFNAESLEMVPLIETDYLASASLRTLFFYEYEQDTRSVFALFDPSQSQAFVWIVNRAPVQMPNLDKLYQELYEKMSEKLGSALAGSRREMHFTLTQTASVKEAEKQLSKELRNSRNATTRPTVVTFVTQKDTSPALRHANLSLFPLVRIHQREPPSMLSVLDWQKVAVSRAIQHFLNSALFLHDYVGTARYLHVPLGNVPADVWLFGNDLFMSRCLQRSGYALWCSPLSKPDLGGKELEDLRLFSEWKPVTEDSAQVYNAPLLSLDECVELELAAVSVTALLQSSRVLEAEGGSDALAFDRAQVLPADALVGRRATITDYDEGAAVAGALRVLKAMAADCVRDIVQHENPNADQLVVNLGRWLRSPSSLLYDPAIARSVEVLEQKLCLLLVAEVERLGAKVMYASASRLVLSTQRAELRAADAFLSSLLESIAKNPLFSSLNVAERRWHALLWLDASNFTGIVGKSSEIESADDRGRVQNVWRLAGELPREDLLKESYEQILVGYLVLSEKHAHEMPGDEEAQLAARKQLISKDITDRVFRVVQKAVKDGNAPAAKAFAFFLARALAVDTAVEEELEKMKEQVKRLLPDDVFDPAEPLQCWVSTLCEHCSQSVSMDLTEELKKNKWHCLHCNNVLSFSQVEGQLVERLNDLLTAYLLQDHKCNKCHAVRRENLSPYCECSGTMENVIGMEELRRNAEAMALVGARRELRLLEETALWVCSSVQD